MTTNGRSAMDDKMTAEQALEATIAFLAEHLNEIRLFEESDRDETLEYHLNRALQALSAQAECDKLRALISDIKDWDCRPMGGFLSLPLALRQRIQEVLEDHIPDAGEMIEKTDAITLFECVATPATDHIADVSKMVPLITDAAYLVPGQWYWLHGLYEEPVAVQCSIRIGPKWAGLDKPVKRLAFGGDEMWSENDSGVFGHRYTAEPIQPPVHVAREHENKP